MTQVESNTHKAVRTNAAIRGDHFVSTPIDRILKKLSRLDLPPVIVPLPKLVFLENIRS
jgi:hypothetical protein